MSSEALILDLSADLAPVRRRRPLREIVLLLALGAIELALFLGFGMMRPDMATVIATPYMIWKLGSLAILAGVGCVIAIRSFSPTVRPLGEVRLALALAILAAIGGAFVAPWAGHGGGSLLARLAPPHGMICAVAIVVLSLPMLAMLVVLMRNAAPTHPEGSALATGLAAGTSGALIFAFCCPVNDPLYIIVWYSTGCAAVVAATRWILPRRFRL